MSPDSCDKGKGSSPTKVVVKENPLFTSDHTHRTCSYRPLMQDSTNLGDVTNGEFFQSQLNKIRKTKEQEMISAVMDVSKCGMQISTNYPLQ